MNDGAGQVSSPAAADKAARGGPVILQVLPALVTGGVERGTVDIAAAITEAGGTALVASEGGPMVREVERAGGHHLTLPLKSKNPWVMWRNVARLTRLIAEHGVDLVHARSRAPAWSARAAARKAEVPFMTTFHATYNIGGIPGKKTYNAVMASGERVIAISDFIGEHVRLTYGAPTSRIRVIHRGVDLDLFDPTRVSGERLIQLARQWNLPEDRPVVLLPGRLTRWKGQGILIDALARLGREDVCAVLVGSDQGRHAYRAELEERVRHLGLEHVVNIVDQCRDMPAAYMLATVVVSASTDPEGFGRVAAEGQAMGRPVIAPAHGAAPEIVRDGETGWLVPPGDPDALAKALGRALDLSADHFRVMSTAARANVAARFSRERMARATLAVYGELLGARGDWIFAP